MAGFNNIEQLRNIGGMDFARSYLWDAYFENGPPPFNSWFPIETCSEPNYNVQEKNFVLGTSEYYIPITNSALNLDMTCYDSENHALEDWIREWVDSLMFQDGLGVRALVDCLRKLTINRISPQKQVIRSVDYYVYPTGRSEVAWDSQSNAKKLMLNFRVAGMNETVLNGVEKLPKVGYTIKRYVTQD